MKILVKPLEEAHEAEWLAVVIDVIRAFTTAPFAFAAGAKEIWPVGRVEEALVLRDEVMDSMVMGEVGGFPPAGFDLGNSPAALISLDLSNRTLIQRTSSGTQGLTRVPAADTVLAASFVVAGATLRHIKTVAPETVTFICTGHSDEDWALADYLTVSLISGQPDPGPYLQRVLASGQNRIATHREFYKDTPEILGRFEADLDCCIDIDHFNFALHVTNEQGRLTMRPVQA